MTNSKLKDSNIEWLGKIPSNWNLIKGKYLFTLRTTKGNTKQVELLSPTQEYGVIPQKLYEKLTGMRPVKLKSNTDLNQMKSIYKGDFCISLRSFQGGFEYSNYDGIVSPAYQVFYPSKQVNRNYFKYLFKDKSFIQKLNSYTMSLRDGKNIAFSDFGNTYLPFPALDEQNKIADFLDKKVSQIDDISKKIQQEITDLEEYRKSIITKAVTKGLNPNVPMKDSGIPWIGKIPQNWKIIKGKYLFRLLSKPVKKDDQVITCFRDGQVTLRVKRRTTGFTMSDQEIGYQGIDKGDLVVHGMDGFAGAIGISDSRGKGSPVLNVLDSNQDKKYMMYCLRATAQLGVFQALAKGIRVRSADTRWSTLANLKYAIPPQSEQANVVNYLSNNSYKLNAIIQAKKDLVEKLNQYKQSIIYEYVTGKKQVPTEEGAVE